MKLNTNGWGMCLALASSFLLSLSSCSVSGTGDEAQTLRTGDLVFVGIPADYSLDEGSMSEAISSSTGEEGALNIIHVAIAEVDEEGRWIIDATIKHGVDRHPLDTFLRDFTLKDGSYPEFIVMRLKDASKAEEFVKNSKKYLGLPYDVWFMENNDAMYCSELVRDSYRTEDGEYLFDANPMNFKNEEGEFPLYWQQLFAMIESEIPQDKPGTNPQHMSESAVLERVEGIVLTD